MKRENTSFKVALYLIKQPVYSRLTVCLSRYHYAGWTTLHITHCTMNIMMSVTISVKLISATARWLVFGFVNKLTFVIYTVNMRRPLRILWKIQHWCCSSIMAIPRSSRISSVYCIGAIRTSGLSPTSIHCTTYLSVFILSEFALFCVSSLEVVINLDSECVVFEWRVLSTLSYVLFYVIECRFYNSHVIYQFANYVVFHVIHLAF